MKRARVPLLIVPLLIVLCASAASADNRVLTSRTVAGVVHIKAVVTDGTGRTLPGALVQLWVTQKFFGQKRTALIDEARTNARGVARLKFAPAERGRFKGVIRFPGASVFAPSEIPVVFRVKDPAFVFEREQAGIGGRLARIWWIVLPVLAIWSVFALAVRGLWLVRRAGPEVSYR